VELHTALFPRSSRLRPGHLIDPATLARESIETEFRGRPVRRLSAEFQFVYLAASWNRDLGEQGIHPSFVFGLFDAVALLRPPFDWNRALGLLDNPVAAASVDVMLASLGRIRVLDAPGQVFDGVRRRHRLLGSGEIRILTSLVERYLVGGRSFDLFNSRRIWGGLLDAEDRPGIKCLMVPWYVAFPRDELRRYDPTFQWVRVRRWLTRRARR
jgi:hypothetical protein